MLFWMDVNVHDVVSVSERPVTFLNMSTLFGTVICVFTNDCKRS